MRRPPLKARGLAPGSRGASAGDGDRGPGGREDGPPEAGAAPCAVEYSYSCGAAEYCCC